MKLQIGPEGQKVLFSILSRRGQANVKSIGILVPDIGLSGQGRLEAESR